MYEIGEYINLKQCQKAILSKKEQNGYGDQYFTKEDIRLRVLYKDEERKKVDGVEEINRICKEISGYEEARSLTLEDIEKSKYLEYKDDTKSNMIFGEENEFNNWIATRNKYYSSNYASFRMFYVGGGAVVAGWLYDSSSNNGSISYAVRPVIEIEY